MVLDNAIKIAIFGTIFLYPTNVSADFNIKNYYLFEDSQRKDDKIILDALLYAQYDAFVALQLKNEQEGVKPIFCPPDDYLPQAVDFRYSISIELAAREGVPDTIPISMVFLSALEADFPCS